MKVLVQALSVLFALLWAVHCQNVVQWEGEPITITPTNPLATWKMPGNINWASSVLVKVTHQTKLRVCIQEMVQAPEYPRWGECTFSSELNLPNSQFNITPSVESYTIAVYGIDMTANTTDQISINVTGAVCDHGHVAYLSKDQITCVSPFPMDRTSPVKGIFTDMDSSRVFMIEVPENSGEMSISFEMEDTAVYSVIHTFNSALTWDTPQQVKNKDALRVPFPNIGVHYVLVSYSGQHSEYTITLSLANCSDPNVKLGCEGLRGVSDPSLSLVGNHTFKFDISSATSFIVGAESIKSTTPPLILLGRGQIPTVTTSLIQGCNMANCTSVMTIKLDNDSLAALGVSTLYVSVQPGNASAENAYAVWFGTECAPNCDLHGKCSVGRICLCDSPDYGNVDCRVLGPTPQTIVLIIIASLVVASTVVGFVAWLYMRKRRMDYEKIG